MVAMAEPTGGDSTIVRLLGTMPAATLKAISSKYSVATLKLAFKVNVTVLAPALENVAVSQGVALPGVAPLKTVFKVNKTDAFADGTAANNANAKAEKSFFILLIATSLQKKLSSCSGNSIEKVGRH